MNIYGLKLIEMLSMENPNEWNHIFESILRNESTQSVLGRALFLQKTELIETTLRLLNKCPVEAAVHIISGIDFSRQKIVGHPFPTINHENRIFVTQKVNRHLQERIEKTIDKILGRDTFYQVFFCNFVFVSYLTNLEHRRSKRNFL